MIKLVAVEPLNDAKLVLTFSDGSRGVWSADELIAKATELTRRLAEPTYFARAFIEAGALAWPNGLELAPWTLHRELSKAGLLRRSAAA